MKKTLLLMLLLISLNALSQDTLSKKEGDRIKITNFLAQKIYAELNTYCEPQEKNPKYIKISGQEYFKQRFKNIFSTVVTTNADVVENGSAFSYVKDKDANTLSINGAHFAEYSRFKWIVDVGISTKMQSESYKFYAENSWANDITGSIGLSVRTHFTNKAKNYKNYISECDSISQIRWQYVNDTLIPRYNKLNKWVYNTQLLNKAFPNELLRKENSFQDQRFEKKDGKIYLKEKGDDLFNSYIASTIRIKDINEILKNKFNASPDTSATEPTVSDLKKELTDLMEIRNTAIELLRFRGSYKDLNVAAESYINKKFGKFDKNHDISTGYSISWLTLKTYLTNSSITIKNQDIIDETFQEKIDNLFKLSLELSWNFNYDKRVFLYTKVYSKFNRGSMLDSQVLKTDGFNVFAETSTIPTSYTIQNDDGLTIAGYDELRNPIYNMDLGAYGAFLFDKAKSIGISGQVSFNFLMKDVQVPYKPNYTLLLGVLLKAKADAVIVNLSSGFENQLYTTNAWDNFIVKASVGVPFTIFEKKAKK